MYQQYFKHKQCQIDQEKSSPKYTIHQNQKMNPDQIIKKSKIPRFRSNDEFDSKSCNNFENQQEKRDKVKLAVRQLESCWKNIKNNNNNKQRKLNLKSLKVLENQDKRIPKQNIQPISKKEILLIKQRNQNLQIDESKKQLIVSQQQSGKSLNSPKQFNEVNMKHVLSSCFQKSLKQNKLGSVGTNRLIKKPLLKKQASSIINYLNRFRNSKQEKGQQKLNRQQRVKKISEFQIENIMFAKRS